MRHGVLAKKFNRPTEHRMSMLCNLAKSLFTHKRIVTTLPKAKSLRPFIEKLVTKGRNNTLANRRSLFSTIRDDQLVSTIMTEFAEKYQNRPGGYTRIMRYGYRKGDAAPMAIIEFVGYEDFLLAKAESKKAEKAKDTEDEQTE